MRTAHMRASLAIVVASLFAVRLIAWRKKISYAGKVAIITGGSRGLGLALARELAQEGARVHLIARDARELDRAARSLGAAQHASVWPCDICDERQIKDTIAAISAEEGRIDLLINNAGIILVAPFEKLQKEDFEAAMNTHFWAPLNASLAALSELKSSRGSIVNIASIGGRVAVPHLASYCASKFALAGLSDCMSAELRKYGVHVTTVSPGLMRTGSHINAEFKGNPKREFMWFSLGATLPLVSINAKRAARQILDAARAGRAELTITPQAKLAVAAQSLIPETVAAIKRAVAALLPSNGGSEKRKGIDCASWISPSILTSLGDLASVELNEHQDA